MDPEHEQQFRIHADIPVRRRVADLATHGLEEVPCDPCWCRHHLSPFVALVPPPPSSLPTHSTLASPLSTTLVTSHPSTVHETVTSHPSTVHETKEQVKDKDETKPRSLTEAESAALDLMAYASAFSTTTVTIMWTGRILVDVDFRAEIVRICLASDWILTEEPSPPVGSSSSPATVAETTMVENESVAESGGCCGGIKKWIGWGRKPVVPQHVPPKPPPSWIMRRQVSS